VRSVRVRTTGTAPFQAPNRTGRINALIFSPDGRSLVVSATRGFRVWDVRSGQPTRAFPVSNSHDRAPRVWALP
jgi:sugar lactone lactonase YvrE